MAVTRQFIATNVRISSQLTERSRPSIQFLVTLIANNRMEITMGKLSTAMRMLLLLAFAAIPESKVSEAAKPKEVAIMTIKKSETSTIGLPRKRIKSISPVIDRSELRKKLYATLERIIETGLAIEYS